MQLEEQHLGEIQISRAIRCLLCKNVEGILENCALRFSKISVGVVQAIVLRASPVNESTTPIGRGVDSPVCWPTSLAGEITSAFNMALCGWDNETMAYLRVPSSRGLCCWPRVRESLCRAMRAIKYF